MAVAPSIDHYYGQTVVDIVDSNEVGKWGIKLESGVIIWNHDVSMPKPLSNIVGLILSKMTLHPKVTTLFFGPGFSGIPVNLSPTQYSIDDSRYGQPIYPQVSEAQSDRWAIGNEVELDEGD